ncbi:MAG: glycoside hydrolase family 88/105 protein [Sphingobacterium sp.]|uniref:glycoside hydrolase family 88/105 protein n=1 Tax=Sphingobacterium sp. JB170 TaxID=1434842 RepID=UPI00097F3BA1|nr:glycoside hydrolase family 88 protein [Sphingobacterium sp. JB170]SJN43463.1 Rhamnogalacturonides degradation protein RhiN [Sphingobacterium sp. JB170]
MLGKTLLILYTFCTFQFVIGQENTLHNFPSGSTPEEVGKRLADHFVGSRHELYAGRWMHYAGVCAWNGAIDYAIKTNDQQLIKQLQDKFEPFFSYEKSLLPPMNHVDYNMFGSLALKLYQVTNDDRYKKLGLAYADSQWEVPANAKAKERAWAEKGHSWQTRLWIDDMYMITVVQGEAYKVTGDKKYLDRAAEEMVMYLDKLQRPNGLFYHAPDVPYYWARGDGWMAVGMPELLRMLPDEHKDRPRIMEGYLKMMTSLKNYQQANGMWNQLIDEPTYWAETSGTAMFAYAFIVGIKEGWLDAAQYAPAARKAWLAMVPYIDKRDNVTEVCIGTGKKNDKQYYYDRPRNSGDLHGQAPYLWCAAELIRK